MKTMKRKSTMKRAVFSLVVVALLFALPVSHTLCFAEWEKKGCGVEGDRKHEAMKNVIAELGLTPEQQNQIDAQRKKQRKETEALRIKLQARRAVLQEELNKPSVNRAAVSDLVKKVNTIRGDMFSQRIEGILAMKEILTPDQYDELKERMKKMRARGKGRKGDERKGQ